MSLKLNISRKMCVKAILQESMRGGRRGRPKTRHESPLVTSVFCEQPSPPVSAPADACYGRCAHTYRFLRLLLPGELEADVRKKTRVLPDERASEKSRVSTE